MEGQPRSPFGGRGEVGNVMLRTDLGHCSTAGSPFLRAIMFCLMSFATLSLLLGSSVFSQGAPGERYKILIDASKDGGLWWFPQAGTFDAEKPHQGKALADWLRQDGAEVIELGRGETITTDKLRGFDLVIRVPAFFTYSSSEALAYQYSVAGGTRLLLFNGGNSQIDRVAEAFGLHFEKRTHFSSLKRWISHPFAPNEDERCECAWSGILKAPFDATFLGWMNDRRETPILGYLPFGQGYVVFTGRTLSVAALRPPFSKGLINAIANHSPADLRLVPASQVVVAETPVVNGPNPIEPNSNSYLPQPGGGEWRFDWDDVPGAVSYELVVIGPHASVPLVHTAAIRSELTIGGRINNDDEQKSGYIADHNLRGWSWRVRAKFADGTLGAWSRGQRFNILPRNN